MMLWTLLVLISPAEAYPPAPQPAIFAMPTLPEPGELVWSDGNEVLSAVDSLLDPSRLGPNSRTPSWEVRPSEVVVVGPDGESRTFVLRHESVEYGGAITWSGVDIEQGEVDLVITRGADRALLTITDPMAPLLAEATESGTRFTRVPDEVVTSDDGVENDDDPIDRLQQADNATFGSAMRMTGSQDSQGDSVDLLFAIQEAASTEWYNDHPDGDLDLMLIHQVGITNAAMRESGVTTGWIRVVGFHKTDWDACPLDGSCLSELRSTSDGNADDVHAARDAAGADLVMGIVADDGGNVAGRAYILGTSGNPSRGFSIVRVDQLQSVGHELGHNLGVWHGRESSNTTCNPSDSMPDYRYGYGWPDPLRLPEAEWAGLCRQQGFNTRMSEEKREHWSDDLEGDYPRLNRFSNPGLYLQRQCADGSAVDVLSGNTTVAPNGCWADAARRFDETFPIVSTYRAATHVPLDMVWPDPGSTLASTTVTFSWTAASPISSYLIDVWEPANPVPTYQFATTSGTSATFFGLSTTEVIAVRILAEYNGDTWGYKHFRFNVDRRVVSCADEDPNLIVNASRRGNTCHNICTYNNSNARLTCDLETTTSAIDAFARTISLPTQHETYDIASYGKDAHGTDYCCLFADPYDVLDEIHFNGTNGDDDLGFVDDSSSSGTRASVAERGKNRFGQLEPYGSNAIIGRIAADSGDDLIVGTHLDRADYTEILRGNAGDDWIYGGDGDDDLLGLPGNDVLYGGPGDDRLYGGTENDELHGGVGSDILRGEEGSDQLFGGEQADTLNGGPGFDDLFGGTHNDILVSTDSIPGFPVDIYDVLSGDEGSDVLCSDAGIDILIGSPPSATSGWNFLYYSQSSGTPSPSSEANGAASNCGHPSHGTGWGSCSVYALSSAPATCAAEGVPD